MNAQDLKNSILQLAIQGKLVEQREEEGTASELLRELDLNKENLLKDMKIRGQKIVSVIKEDEVPFDIPKTWRWVRLSQLGVIIGGGTPKTSNSEYWKEGTIPWLTPADMKYVEGKYVSKGGRSITQVGLDKSSARLMPKGTLVYSSRAPIGYIAIAKNEVSTNQGFKSLVPAIEDINEYFYYCLISRTREIESRASGTTFKEISGAEFAKTMVPLPPLEEQKRIVAKIEELKPYVDRYGDAYEKVTALNKNFPVDMEKSILQYAIQGKLVEQREEEGTAEELFKQVQEEKQKLIDEEIIKKQKNLLKITEEEILFDVPENWKWVRLGDLLNKLTDGAHHTPKYTTEGIPFLSVKDISSGKINFSNTRFVSQEEHNKLYKRCNPEKGDILLTKVGTTGIPVIVNTDKEFSLFVSVALLKFNNSLLFNEYLLYALKSPLVQMQAKKNTRGVANKNWVMRDIANTVLPLPPLEEQKRIVAKIEELLNYSKVLHDKTK